MEGHQQDIPLNYASQQLSLDALKPRYPLADSAGNAQGPPLDNIYNDRKGVLNCTPHSFSLPILQSQQAQRPQNQTSLEFRKSQTRSHRFHRSRNPIVESENYQNYRSRQTRDNVKDMKWPDDLEDLFLDALLDMPKMGRRKFCFNGKLHGRNELISLYLWIGHCESLLPSQKPDETKRRDRKQVSSHIQVLKGFMRGHPSFHILFPKKGAKNEIEDSFKDDPCLRALTQNRLPYKRRNCIEHVTTINDQPSSPSPRSQSLRPYFFSMWMTVHRPGFGVKNLELKESPSNDSSPRRFHTYSETRPRSVNNESLEFFPNWQSRFPALARLLSTNQLNCDIIHMETSLELRRGSCPENSELWGRFEILIPGTDCTNFSWRCIQTMHKPADLYGKARHDPPYESVGSEPVPIKYVIDVGTSLRVTFPAVPWAHALGKLSEIREDFDESLCGGGRYPIQTLPHQYIQQISIYQEIFSSTAPNQPWQRRAIILWTFKECRAGEKGESTWRYLYPGSSSQSYSLRPSHDDAYPAIMPESFSAWIEASSLPGGPLQNSTASSLNSIPQELEFTSQPVGEMESPFPKYNYYRPDLIPENTSFMSREAQENDMTLVDSQGNNHTHPFMQSGDMSLGGFDPIPNFWNAPPLDNFDINAEFQLSSFSNTATSNCSMHTWDGMVKNQPWDTVNAGFESV